MSDQLDLTDAHGRRIRRIVYAAIRQRAAGESVSDQEILAAHPELAAELTSELAKLDLISRAQRRIPSGSDSTLFRGSDSVPDPAPAWRDAPAGYEIIDEIHRGGQGIVYRALQLSTGREVAIKTLREGDRATPDARARFEREVRVLAGLRHPNIVTVHDSGSVGGRDYFVMQYVAGPPFHEYAAQLRAGVSIGGAEQDWIDALLRTMVLLCDAVNAAHLVGVIHRDLKPGNIRLNEAGQPQVLDFGLAKPTDDDSEMTLAGQFLGSVVWASPEQAHGGVTIDVRSDVYALGLVLYHGLTGEFPYPVAADTRTVLNHIVATAPRPPRELQRAIPQDLQTIVLRCLAKDPQHRYQNAGELSRDLRNHLSGAPIDARRDSLAYLLRKLAWRHRVAAAVSTAFVLLLAVGVVVSATLYARAERQRHLADQSAALTERVSRFQSEMLGNLDVDAMGLRIQELLRAQVGAGSNRNRVSHSSNARRQFLEDTNDGVAPFAPRLTGAQTADVARRLIDEFVLAPAGRALEERFGDQPLVRARMQNELGELYAALGLYSRAELCLRAALELRRSELGFDHELAAASLNNLGELLRLKGDLEESEACLRSALGMRRAIDGNPRLTVDTLNNLGLLLEDRSNYAEAEQLLREALTLDRDVSGEGSPELAITLNNLAMLLYTKGDYVEGESLCREALALQRNLLGNDHRDVARSLVNLGYFQKANGNPAEAGALFREALTMHRTMFGDDHPETTITMSGLASVLKDQGDYAAAESLFREVLESQRRMLGSNHADLAMTLDNLATVLSAQGALQAAEPLFHEALDIRRAHFGDEHIAVASSLNNLASLLHDKGDYAAAEPHYREALRVVEELLGTDNAHAADCLNNLGLLLRDKGDYAEAELLLRDSLDRRRSLWGEDHPGTALGLHNLATLLLAAGDHEEAEQLFRLALEQFVRWFGADHPRSQHARISLARALIKLGRFPQAETLLLDAAERQDRTEPGRPWPDGFRALVQLYEAWHAAEPGIGRDADAAAWRKKQLERQAPSKPTFSSDFHDPDGRR